MENETFDTQDPNDLAHLGNPEPEEGGPGYEEEAPAEEPEESGESMEGYEPGDPEPEPEEAPLAAEKAEEKPKIPKISIKSRINQLNREKYQALEIAERMQQENEELRRNIQEAKYQAEQSAKAAMQFYDNSSELRLSQADKALQEAIESGDVQAQAKAQREIAALSAEIENAKAWKVQNAYREEQERLRAQMMPPQQPAYYPPQQDANTPSGYATEWLSSNPWFDERSQHYNPTLAEKIQDFSDELDDHFYRNGMGHKVGNSPEYFNAINMRASELSKGPSYSNTTRRGEIPMRSSRTPVAPVRSSSGYVSSGSRNQGSDLSPSEKFWAKQFGVSESAYKKERDMDIRSGRRSQGR